MASSVLISGATQAIRAWQAWQERAVSQGRNRRAIPTESVKAMEKKLENPNQNRVEAWRN